MELGSSEEDDGGGGGEGCRGRGKQWNEVRPHSAERDEKLMLTLKALK